jgi:hypothetical protein
MLAEYGMVGKVRKKLGSEKCLLYSIEKEEYSFSFLLESLSSKSAPY